MCHGGICRVITRWRMAFAQGRVSSYVTSDMGASEPLRWHSWHRSWKIGAISLANVTALAVSAGPADVAASAPSSAAGSVAKAANTKSLTRVITGSFGHTFYKAPIVDKSSGVNR